MAELKLAFIGLGNMGAPMARNLLEAGFDVTVTDVRTIAVKAKPKRRGRSAGTRPGWKKAIVELQPGDSIDIFEGA